MRAYTSLIEQRFMCSVKDIKHWVRGLLVVLVTSLLSACDVEDIVTLGPLNINEVTSDAIHCSVEVSGEMPFDCGFCYATTKIGAESSTASKVKAIYRQHDISGTIEGLKPNTTYFVRGYVMTVRGRICTETLSVKTTLRTPQGDDNRYPDIDY